MKIKVLTAHIDRYTYPKVIQPGEYDINDGGLFGRSDYLLKIGRAKKIKAKRGRPPRIVLADGKDDIKAK